MIRAGAFLKESALAFGFPRLLCGRPAVVGEWNDQLGGASRGCRSSARAYVNRIPDRDGSTVAIRRTPTIEHRQGRDGVDREPGEHLRVFVSIDVLLLDDDIAHEGLEHQGRHPERFVRGVPRPLTPAAEVWINPPENRPTARTLELPRDTKFVPQLSQSH